MTGLIALHGGYAGLLFLYMVSEGLAGAMKAQIEAFLGLASMGILVWIWISYGFVAALIALMLTLVYVPVLKPAADWTSDRLMGRGKAPKANRQLRSISGRLESGGGLAALSKGGVEGFLSESAKKDEVKKQLFELCRNQPETAAILKKHGASDEDLDYAYSGLLAAGCGQRVGRHWVAASALAYADTLDRTMAELKEAQPDWRSLCSEMLDRFGAFG